jgi:hypothetical protein
MTVKVDMSGETYESLTQRANEQGMGIGEFLRSVADREARLQRFDTAFRPVQRAFEESGLTEEEVEAEGRAILAEVRGEKAEA